MIPSADAAGRRTRHDARVSVAHIVLLALLAWLAVAVVVGSLVGHGIALGAGRERE
jgi:hypothetical protein